MERHNTRRNNKHTGLKQVAKLCLNKLWGETALISGLISSNLFENYPGFINQLLRSDTLHTQDTNNLCENCVEIKYAEPSDYVIGQEFINEIVAVFTTSNARLRLYNMLDWLDASQVMYCDTDSVMCLYDETNPSYKSLYNETDIDDAQHKA